LETDYYDVYHTVGSGLEVISYNGWDDAYTQYFMKYEYHGQYLEHNFLDAEESDWNNWKKAGSSYYGQTALVGPNGYIYFIDDYDLDEAGLTSAIENIIYGDEDPPYVENLNPEDGETDVDLDDNVKGHVKDDNFGVDEESVTVDVNTADRGEIPGSLNLTGDFLDFMYTFNPSDDLPHYSEIFVTVNAADLAEPPNEMDEYTYSFLTRSFYLEEPDDGDVIEVSGARGETPEHGALSGNLSLSPGSGGRTGVDVTFEWEEVVRAESYELIVDDNDDFSSPEVDVTGITDPEYTYTFDVTDDATYYWYVICNAPDGDFDSADVFSFEFDYNTNVAPASLGQIKAGFAE
jgi:hypothetical protein